MMTEAIEYDEYASLTMHFNFDLSDAYCAALACDLQLFLRAEFGDDTVVKVFVDDDLLFVECGMCSFGYMEEYAGSVSAFIKVGVEHWIENTAKEATAKLFSNCAQSNVV